MIIYIGPTRFRRKRFKPMMVLKLQIQPLRIPCKSCLQGRIHDFKLGGALKNIEPSGGRRENVWGISCEKSRFYAKKSYFFQL